MFYSTSVVHFTKFIILWVLKALASSRPRSPVHQFSITPLGNSRESFLGEARRHPAGVSLVFFGTTQLFQVQGWTSWCRSQCSVQPQRHLGQLHCYFGSRPRIAAHSWAIRGDLAIAKPRADQGSPIGVRPHRIGTECWRIRACRTEPRVRPTKSSKASKSGSLLLGRPYRLAQCCRRYHLGPREVGEVLRLQWGRQIWPCWEAYCGST